MKFKDYYRVVGVAPDASLDAIKNAYRTLARKLHPDVNKQADAERRFTDLGEAYEALKDPAKRAAYDQLRAGGWREGQEVDVPTSSRSFHADDAGGVGDDGFGAGDAARFSAFFQSMFSGRGQGARGGPGRQAFPRRGEDIHHPITVSLEEAYHGGERQFQLRVPQIVASGGVVEVARTLNAKLPKGMVAGTRIRLRGQGHPGPTTEENGDLYLEVELAAHALYRVDGRDLAIDLTIAPWEAVLGAQVAVPTLDGQVTATIPPGAQAGEKLRLKGRGLPGEPPGDQYLVLRIAVPPQVSEKSKDLYRALAKEAAGELQAQVGA